MVRVAIIGSGVAGLAAASALHEQGIDFRMFEADAHVGGHARSFKVGDEGVEIDTGFMVFNTVTYPNLLDWFEKHNVEIEPSDMSFSVSVNGGFLEWSSSGIEGLFAQKSNYLNPYMYRMVYDMRRFQGEVEAYLAAPEKEKATTLGEFLTARGYSKYFADYYLVPVCSSVWSCPPKDALGFPLQFIFRFMKNHHLLQFSGRPEWITIAGRTRTGYVEKVTAPFKDKIEVSTAVESVEPLPGGQAVRLTFRGGRAPEVFEKVIFAAHAPDALKMLGQHATVKQKEVIGAFGYQMNRIVVHSDASFMPKAQATWSSWNFLSVGEGSGTCTYWLNHIQNIPKTGKNYFITLNPPTDPKSIHADFQTGHPVPTVASEKAAARFHEIQGENGIFFCGAYQRYGFHEDGAISGFAAAHMLAGKPYVPLPNHKSWELGVTDGLKRKWVIDHLRQYAPIGRLQIVELGGKVTVIGDGKGPKAFLTVKSPQFWSRIASDWDVGFGESYMHGEVVSPDLIKVFELIIENRDNNLRRGMKATPLLAEYLPSWVMPYLHRNKRGGNDLATAKKNISAHYDLGNDFFSLFLDSETSAYSCGIFASPQTSLADAQWAKIDELIRKADVSPAHYVLDLGCGWGGLTFRLAEKHGCKVKAITLSDQQFKHVGDQIKKRGLHDKVSVQLVDYRVLEPSGVFDRILSCEMLEAIGHDEYSNFFKHTQRLLKPAGKMCVQVITTPDHRYEEYRRSEDFINKHIFPGGLCPSLSALTTAMAAVSTFTIQQLEDIGHHYTPTLLEWRRRFWINVDKVKALGFDDVFVRKWDYYFLYCAAGFKTGTLGDLHILFALPQPSH